MPEKWHREILWIFAVRTMAHYLVLWQSLRGYFWYKTLNEKLCSGGGYAPGATGVFLWALVGPASSGTHCGLGVSVCNSV